ncbi:MAG: response regulator transcription factor [Chloroflexi bacterium]|nr:response regulator transcription factor [Chloroflexota bacterium]
MKKAHKALAGARAEGSVPWGMRANQAIRILVIDDHPLMLSGAVALVRRQPDIKICGEAASAEEALEQAMSTRPDVIVLDLRLRGGVQNGMELLPPSCVLVYSAYLADSGIRDLSKAGVAGYISKTAHPDQLAQAIRTVAAGTGSASSTGLLESRMAPRPALRSRSGKSRRSGSFASASRTMTSRSGWRGHRVRYGCA